MFWVGTVYKKAAGPSDEINALCVVSRIWSFLGSVQGEGGGSTEASVGT